MAHSHLNHGYILDLERPVGEKDQNAHYFQRQNEKEKYPHERQCS